jgi:uracil-DNA glycosylase
MPLKRLLRQVRACTICKADLPLGARPVLQVAASARLLILSQAPGRKVHETGVPWDDASGERLRDWMAIDRSAFYDEELWHGRLLQHLSAVEHTLLVGHHAQRFQLGGARKDTMTDTVRSFRQYAPRFTPLPHPSWRSVAWMRRHPWFEATVIPELRRVVRAATRR